MNYISSIANVCPGKFMVCKHPVEDFNDGSILTVNPGEQAIFLNNGVVEAVFCNGRYELTTQNYPFINAFRRFLANGQLTYHCSVFFVSETQSAEVLWGFSFPVRDPVQKIYTKVMARGSYTVKVKDAGELLLQVTGMNINFLAAPDLKHYFGTRFQQLILNLLSKHVSESGREVIDLCGDYLSVADKIALQLSEMVTPFGFEITNFAIAALQIDENDPNRRILEEAYAKSREMEIMGDRYRTIKTTDMQTNASQTQYAGLTFGPNATSVQTNAGINIATGQPTPAYPGTQPPHTHSAATSGASLADKIKELAELKEAGLLTDEEFSNLKQQLLQKIL